MRTQVRGKEAWYQDESEDICTFGSHRSMLRKTWNCETIKAVDATRDKSDSKALRSINIH